MRKKLLSILAGMMIMAGALTPAGAFATGDGGGGSCRQIKFFGLDPWYATLICDSDGNISGKNFEKDKLQNTVIGIVGTVVKDLLFVVGILSVVLTMVGGIQYMLSAGDPMTMTKAKKTISGAITGLVISLLAYAIVTAVLKTVGV
ncbi:hypothetical protein IKE71_01165 [Candidatus Saccharibacteria bacterium]|nr:hypothetical protein [Candidatus Saccharibacteria bacterium]